jgi:hypothetical protein
VNEKGHGYRLETPLGSVVDLGTEFGVSVDGKTGATETHVLEGEVEAIPRNGDRPILLRKGEAFQQKGGLNVRIPLSRSSFYLSLPPAHQSPLAMIHWDMEADGSSRLPARTRGLREDGLGLEFLAEGRNIVPSTLEGPFGKAIHFDGERVFGQSGFKGISGSSARTVAFWVKVPSDFDPCQGFAMGSWGDWDRHDPGRVWQVSVNPIAEDGPIGRLRVGAHRGQAIGTIDLRDDRWHHVAIVLYSAENPDFGKHVLLFVDGELDPVSQSMLGVIDTSTKEARHVVWL